MRLVSTFNQALYEASGRELIESITLHHPNSEILIYEELDGDQLDVPTVAVSELPELHEVQNRFRHLISTSYGGTAKNLTGYQQRWFGWFRKVLMQYDAIVRRPIGGYTVFLDSDTRFVQPLTETTIAQHLHSAVGFCKGNRECVESGVLIYDDRRPEASEFATAFLEIFTSGRFQQLKRWDDSYTMAACAAEHPHCCQDFAEGAETVHYENSNGYSTGGHIIPQTFLSDYIEHDKGVHWKQGVVPSFKRALPRSRNPLSRLARAIRNRLTNLTNPAQSSHS